jgi:hypothetical protein
MPPFLPRTALLDEPAMAPGDNLGRVESLSTYDDPHVGECSVVNQVEYEYNDRRQLARECQDHDAAVDAKGRRAAQKRLPTLRYVELEKGGWM